MAEVTLTAETGRVLGSRSSGRLRLEGKVPAVLYGHGMEPISIAVDRRQLRAVLHTEAGHNAVVDLAVDGGTHLAIVKHLQRHPVRNDVVHVDFLAVNRDEVVSVEVPVVLEGESVEVHNAQGTIEQQLFTLTIQAKPGDIPNSITIDVSGMNIGDSVRVGDLQLPLGAATDLDPEETVVVAQLTRASLGDEAEAAEAGEGGEGGDAEGGDEATAEAGGEGDSAGGAEDAEG
jgi:large subunit ribosomal protein L25